MGCTFEIKPVFLGFSVISSESGRDLFFSSVPAYEINDIYFFKSIDIAKKDTIRPFIEGYETERIFRI